MVYTNHHINIEGAKVDFRLYTTALKAYTADNGDLYVRGTTSSTIRDLHGDEMTLNALHTMRDTAKNNMTIWLNHNYNVPDDIFGSVSDAFIEKRMDAETGQEVYDLDIAIRVVGEDENPLAMKAYRAIKRGVKLGLSIGARVEKVSKRKDNNDQETYVIDSVRLLESSIVGIPANQRSYLQNALKSVRGGAGNLPDIDDLLEGTKSAEGRFKVGDMVTWGSSGGDATGKITKIVREGKLEVPDSSFTIEADEDDPAVLIRVYRDAKPSDRLVGHKMSTLRAAKSFDASAEAFTVETETEEETFDMDELDQKKTRVTVTVSTDAEANNEAAAAVAPSAPAAAAPLEEVEAAAPEVEVEPVVEEPAVEPAPAEPVVEEPAAEEPVAEEHPAAAPEADLSDLLVLASADEVVEKAGASVAERLAIVVKELKSIADQYAKDESSNADSIMKIVDALNKVLGEEGSSPASEMPTKSTDSNEITAPEGNALVELESLAKSALDAALSAQQDVAAIRREFTELSGEKAKVESELAKALDVVGRLMNLPGGRKEIEPTGTKGATAISAPWLSPYIQRVLDTEE